MLPQFHMFGDLHSKLRIPPSKLDRVVEALLAWYTRHHRDLPWRRTRDPYAIWISEIMLQQTQVATVRPYWEHWMSILPTVESLAHARAAQLHKLWEGLGYYRRVDHLRKAARVIMKSHHGRFPRRYEEVLALPGVGRYTAGAICSIAFNQPAPILDGNVMRVLARIFGIGGDPRKQTTNAQLWELAEILIQNPKLKTQNSRFGCSRFNQAMMELGAVICTPRQPDCAHCPVASDCTALHEDRIVAFPGPTRRTPTTTRRFAAFVVQRAGSYLVRQRPHGVVNARLWEFPNAELPDAAADLRSDVCGLLGFRPRSLIPLCTVKHSITRYRITLEAWLIPVPGPQDQGKVPLARASNGFARKRTKSLEETPEPGRWLTLPNLEKLSFPSAHRKILAAIARAADSNSSGHPSPLREEMLVHLRTG